jgi:hypothetical protein
MMIVKQADLGCLAIFGYFSSSLGIGICFSDFPVMATYQKKMIVADTSYYLAIGICSLDFLMMETYQTTKILGDLCSLAIVICSLDFQMM